MKTFQIRSIILLARQTSLMISNATAQGEDGRNHDVVRLNSGRAHRRKNRVVLLRINGILRSI